MARNVFGRGCRGSRQCSDLLERTFGSRHFLDDLTGVIAHVTDIPGTSKRNGARQFATGRLAGMTEEQIGEHPRAVAYEESYAGSLRRMVGTGRLITPGPRAVIHDRQGRVLLVRRSDDHSWVMPAGGVELGESIWDALVREVAEETGLQVQAATVIALYTQRRFWFTNAYGGEHQMFTVVFRVDEWSGTLNRRTNETLDARFFAPDELPNLAPVYQETLDDLVRFDGRVIVK